MKSKSSNLDELDEAFYALLERGKVEKEIATMRRSNRVTIPQLKAIFDMGVDFYNQFQFKEAEIVFSAYSALNPYDHRGTGCLAAIYLENKQFQKALDMLNILKTFPTNELDETILNIALCHYKLEQKLEAASMLLIVRPDGLNEYYGQRYRYLEQQLSPYFS
ncbi:TPA: regulator [Vibrio parahaemolyticus]|uniref:regulator n=1 Tax=Vibrio harveyi TaxID=669 RepID=UPI0012632742|nr:regulator [Vibrio harveyi]EIO5095971.1 regulator [Vibrio parahaemolyticus]ELY5143092.1 regulator [Vibrio vulnificus]EKO3870291.1 regulator [Vibrio harveyi]ELC3158199.1 regulator [Vibrio harveyi]QFQ77501.1 regulator [Vibrio harveyi]